MENQNKASEEYKEKIKELEKKIEELKEKFKNHRHDGHGYAV